MKDVTKDIEGSIPTSFDMPTVNTAGIGSGIDFSLPDGEDYTPPEIAGATYKVNPVVGGVSIPEIGDVTYGVHPVMDDLDPRGYEEDDETGGDGDGQPEPTGGNGGAPEPDGGTGNGGSPDGFTFSTVTSNPIESGAEINDHVNNASGTLNISGVIIGGNSAINALKAMRASRDIITYIGVTRMSNLVFTSLKFDRSYKNRNGASFSATFKQVQISSPEYVPMDGELPMTSQDVGKFDDQQLAKTANAGLTMVSLQSVSSSSAERYKEAYTQPSSSAPLTRQTGAYDGLTA